MGFDPALLPLPFVGEGRGKGIFPFPGGEILRPFNSSEAPMSDHAKQIVRNERSDKILCEQVGIEPGERLRRCLTPICFVRNQEKKTAEKMNK